MKYEDALEQLNIKEWKIIGVPTNIEEFKSNFYKLYNGTYNQNEETFGFTYDELENKFQEIQAAEPLRLLRIERDRLLQECDWRDLPSYPGTDQEEWRTYRQALRDLPNNSEPQLNDAGELINIVWPEKPNGGV